MKDVCLWIHVEGNFNKGGGGGSSGQENKKLEEEAVRCVNAWRKYGGKYANIPIYALCLTNNPPSRRALRYLDLFDVKFIWNYCKETDNYPAGWWVTPTAGMWVEQMLSHTHIFHIDLDMTLLKPFNIEIKDDVRIPVYTKENPDDRQIDPRFPKKFITCYIESSRESKFYETWYDTMMYLADEWKEKYPQLKNNWEMARESVSDEVWWDYCNLEEHAVDVMNYDGFPIIEIKNLMIGDCQGYLKTEELTKENIDDIYFIHHHFDNDEHYKRIIKEYVLQRTKIKLCIPI